MSSAFKGTEREIFVTNVLSQVFPPHFRFTSGDIVDSNGNQTGQVDVVLEKPRGYSFPLANIGPRLFLAENAAAVIEVKSNLSDQWDEVTSTAEKLSAIRPMHAREKWMQQLAGLKMGKMNVDESVDTKKLEASLLRMINDDDNSGNERIPLIAVGVHWVEKTRHDGNETCR